MYIFHWFEMDEQGQPALVYPGNSHTPSPHLMNNYKRHFTILVVGVWCTFLDPSGTLTRAAAARIAYDYIAGLLDIPKPSANCVAPYGED